MTPEAKVKVGDCVWIKGQSEHVYWKVEHEDVGGLTLLSRWVNTNLIMTTPNNDFTRSNDDTRSKS
jgi:hypothetical protein